MTRKLLLTLITILVLAPISLPAQVNPASEEDQSLLHKSEIIDLMSRVGKMPVQQQNEKIDRLWANNDGSKTPRSDFLYCTAFAYFDHSKAQACLGRDFENGRGIVQNNMDAYVWYTIALDHPDESAAFKQKVQADQTRVKQILFSVYPAPSDYELEEAVKKQKEKISQYMAETGKAGE